MLARIAHELYWLGRNLVRAEHTARMLDGVFQGDLQGRPDDPSGVHLSWGSLMTIMGANPEGRPYRRDEVLARLTVDASDPASVVSCVDRAREGARTVRDVLSDEVWRALNTMYLDLAEPGLARRLQAAPSSVYQDVKERSALFWGLTSRTMLRDDASAFLVAGGRLEAGDMVLRMLRVATGRAAPNGQVDAVRDGQALALLQAAGGFQAFRRAVPAAANTLPVARFLLYERAFPDSVAASVQTCEDVLERADASPRSSEPILRLSRLSADLEFRRRAEAGPVQLQQTLEDVQQELIEVDRAVAERYFAGAAVDARAVVTA